jgi:hypothetical protein
VLSLDSTDKCSSSVDFPLPIRQRPCHHEDRDWLVLRTSFCPDSSLRVVSSLPGNKLCLLWPLQDVREHSALDGWEDSWWVFLALFCRLDM